MRFAGALLLFCPAPSRQQNANTPENEHGTSKKYNSQAEPCQLIYNIIVQQLGPPHCSLSTRPIGHSDIFEY
jgi:hypothetical protein